MLKNPLKFSLPFGFLASALLLILSSVTGWSADAPTEGKLAAKWVFADFADGEVKNQVAEGGPLVLQNSEPPVLEEEMGVKGLRFGHSQCLYGKTNELPDIGGGFGEPGQPFAVRMTFVQLEKQEGAYGGLFQAMLFGESGSGFRLVINQGKRLMVEIPGAEGVVGNTAIEFGVAYTVELRYDGSKITLLLDGQVDAEKEVAIPAPFTGDFRIGQASGQNYDFNGIIGEVSIFSLQP